MSHRLGSHQAGSNSPRSAQKLIASNPAAWVRASETARNAVAPARRRRVQRRDIRPVVAAITSSPRKDQFHALSTGSG
ncbi:hypothetical protein FHX46_005014 [Amycolatopsis viridis]|uniref:Uncharacterized protein n=1 Tax=Amycolatopsis viridis TaxID=185678 RepID=A0ABX0T3J9_9PSEU|nr:hypothetical protein [Amycolatopsis viridis]NIH82484.1 hypothetical protein [Amycolatopsis viridis]